MTVFAVHHPKKKLEGRELQVDTVRMAIRKAKTKKAKFDVAMKFMEDIEYSVSVIDDACKLEDFDRHNAWKI